MIIVPWNSYFGGTTTWQPHKVTAIGRDARKKEIMKQLVKLSSFFQRRATSARNSHHDRPLATATNCFPVEPDDDVRCCHQFGLVLGKIVVVSSRPCCRCHKIFNRTTIVVTSYLGWWNWKKSNIGGSKNNFIIIWLPAAIRNCEIGYQNAIYSIFEFEYS